ncbi:hypothetical protein AC1031_002053 [Aphanomyces cochlioides]|nr:hypothetical protein AC1031_002053 [Aphanomyces cochlioides]
MTDSALSMKVAKCVAKLASCGEWIADKTFSKLQSLVREKAKSEDKDAMLRDVMPLAAPMTNLLPSIKAHVVRATCMLIATLALTLGMSFSPFADQVLVALLHVGRETRLTPQGRVKTSNMIRNAGESCLDVLSTHCYFDLDALMDEYYAPLSGKNIRRLVVKQLGIAMKCRTKAALERYHDRIQDCIHDAIHDHDIRVRQEARAVFCTFSDIWEEDLDDLVHIPPAETRSLLVACYPRERITLALEKQSSPMERMMNERMMAEPMMAEATMPKTVLPESMISEPVVLTKTVVDDATHLSMLDVHILFVMGFLLFLCMTVVSFPVLVRRIQDAVHPSRVWMHMAQWFANTWIKKPAGLDSRRRHLD